MSRMYPTEDPGSSQKKRRNPQTRDYRARAFAQAMGDGGLGSGRTMERCLYATKRVAALKSQGHTNEAALLEAAINVSIRGAYELARLSDEAFFGLCKMVADHEELDLISARRIVKRVAESGQVEGIEAAEPVTLARAKNDMYRIRSLHNHSSVLVSAQDLIELSKLIGYLMPELEEKVS